jgi:anti-sigma regulatory factor (Ser/Thr protein kinase)
MVVETEAVLSLAPTSAARARHLVRQFLGAEQNREFVEAAELAVSELVTNAVRYARPPINVAVHLDGALLRIDVHDGSRRRPRTRPCGPESTTGRGLHLVERVAVRWGTEVTRTGKSVWCELRAPGGNAETRGAAPR